MKERPKKHPTPDSLLRMWLFLGVFVGILFGGAAIYLHSVFSRLQSVQVFETATAREYLEKRLPELEAVADRQEVLDELAQLATKTERFLRQANAREESLLLLLGYWPRLMALTTGMLLFVILLGYGYLRTMKRLCERQSPSGPERGGHEGPGSGSSRRPAQ